MMMITITIIMIMMMAVANKALKCAQFMKMIKRILSADIVKIKSCSLTYIYEAIESKN